MAEVVVMVTSSYPRFPGDSVGTFMEPIARAVAARGHEVHVVAPWHPLMNRPAEDHGVRLHLYRYAPHPALNVFGYASAMRADVRLRGAAWLAAPLALAAGWRTAASVARRYRATVMHGHWVVPGGATAAAAAPRLPLVISLHGSDVYVAETVPPARVTARAAFRRAGFVTACSDDLTRRAVALGAAPDRIETVPYGVDEARFRPDEAGRAGRRASLRVTAGTPLLFAAGRLVRKKGFEFLIDALAQLPGAVLALAGAGTLGPELEQRAAARGVANRVRFLGNVNQDEVARYLSAADIVVVPSVRDDAGNVDGLPNVVLEALASGTPVVATPAGGIGAVIEDGVTGFLVPERDPGAIAAAAARLIAEPGAGRAAGAAARTMMRECFGWDRVGARLEAAYAAALAFRSARQLTFTG